MFISMTYFLFFRVGLLKIHGEHRGAKTATSEFDEETMNVRLRALRSEQTSSPKFLFLIQSGIIILLIDCYFDLF